MEKKYNNEHKEEKVFLCSFCGIFIRKNLNNLLRHEQLHDSSVKKIQCVMFRCESKFQQKCDYYRHWQIKHANIKMPDGFIYVDEGRKSYRKKIKRKADEKCVLSSRPNDFEILNHLGLIEKSAENIRLPKPCCEPFFGKLDCLHQWRQQKQPNCTIFIVLLQKQPYCITKFFYIPSYDNLIVWISCKINPFELKKKDIAWSHLFLL